MFDVFILTAEHGLQVNGATQSKHQTNELEPKSSCIIELNNDDADQMKLEDRTVEGDPQAHTEAEQLTKQVAELQQQLETQSKVCSLKLLSLILLGTCHHHL